MNVTIKNPSITYVYAKHFSRTPDRPEFVSIEVFLRGKESIEFRFNDLWSAVAFLQQLSEIKIEHVGGI